MKDITINEDNKSILDLINYIDSKIVTLRKENKFSENSLNSLSKDILKYANRYRNCSHIESFFCFLRF